MIFENHRVGLTVKARTGQGRETRNTTTTTTRVYK